MKKRYSFLIKPIQIFADIFIINVILSFYFQKSPYQSYLSLYLSFFWVITAYFLRYYKVYRYTRFLRLLTLLVRQFSFFSLGFFAFFGVFHKAVTNKNDFVFLVLIFSIITINKFIWFILLKKYRAKGNNSSTAIIIGFDDSSKNIIKLFKNKSSLGYKYLGFFDEKFQKSKEYLGNISEIQNYIKSNNVDEIYCSTSSVSSDKITHLKKLAAIYGMVFKLIPDANHLYSKNQNIEYYDDTLMVLNVEKLPFEYPENYILKRTFDIIFSIFICVTVLSWLYPILWLIIKIDSKGPAIFAQKREGLNGEHFTCYKFRSMQINSLADKIHATKNDERVTKIGAFLRKTSLDELPQFFNVIKGNMSVVGPRPHIQSLSLEYQKEVDDYLKRHLMKPGITGLAQVSGYRGEVKKNSDIKNRVRLDIFYIENWSFFLDIKIIIQTVFSVLKGDEKAY